MKGLRVTAVDIKRANSNGGPTFSPRAQGRFVCNQMPLLGRLKKGQVRSIKRACGSPPVQKANPAVLPSPTNPRYVSYGSPYPGWISFATLYPERRERPGANGENTRPELHNGSPPLLYGGGFLVLFILRKNFIFRKNGSCELLTWRLNLQVVLMKRMVNQF